MELLTKAISFTMSSLSTWLGSKDLLKMSENYLIKITIESKSTYRFRHM